MSHDWGSNITIVQNNGIKLKLFCYCQTLEENLSFATSRSQL